MKHTLLFTAIALILATGAQAVTSTVTSKDYVDTAVATKQAKIPAVGTNASTPGESVVTYTNTAGTIGERGIFDPVTGFDFENMGVVSGHEGDLVTAELFVSAMDDFQQHMTDLGEQIPQDGFYQQRAMTPPTCAETASNGDCLLWNIGNVIDVFSPNDREAVCSLDGESCRDASTCCGGGCNPNTHTCYTEVM